MLSPEFKTGSEKKPGTFFFLFFGENNCFKRNILQAGLIQCAKTSSININKRLL